MLQDHMLCIMIQKRIAHNRFENLKKSGQIENVYL